DFFAGTSAGGRDALFLRKLREDQLIRLVERRDLLELAVGNLDLILPLDRRDDLDAHHRIDPQLLEMSVLRNRVDLRDLGNQGTNLFFQAHGVTSPNTACTDRA